MHTGGRVPEDSIGRGRPMDSWGSEVAEMASQERERHSDRYGMGSRGEEARSKVTTKVDDTWLKQTVEQDRGEWKESH